MLVSVNSETGMHAFDVTNAEGRPFADKKIEASAFIPLNISIRGMLVGERVPAAVLDYFKPILQNTFAFAICAVLGTPLIANCAIKPLDIIIKSMKLASGRRLMEADPSFRGRRLEGGGGFTVEYEIKNVQTDILASELEGIAKGETSLQTFKTQLASELTTAVTSSTATLPTELSNAGFNPSDFTVSASDFGDAGSFTAAAVVDTGFTVTATTTTVAAE